MQATNSLIRVPYGQTVHGDAEIDAVVKVLRTSTQMGLHVSQFEQQVAALFNKTDGIMVNSGTSALFLAVEILDLPKGSEVITPALTFSSTVACLVKNGLVPAFIDVEPNTYCIDPSKIEAMITPKTTAICAPNLIGNVCKWKEISEIAKKYRLRIIEDSADTLGATLNDKPTGIYSDISITSFYGSHIINCAGNGGMLCLSDKHQVEKAKLLRSWGRSSSLFQESEAIENRFNVNLDGIDYDAKFVFETVGYNLEPSELGAAFGLVQLEALPANIRTRQANFKRMLEFFKPYQAFFDLPKEAANVSTAWLAFPVIINNTSPFSRRDLQIFLEKRNIQTRVIFTGNILRQPGFRAIEHRKCQEGYPEADRVMKGGMLIGCHHGLTEAMIQHVFDSLTLFLSAY